jgi:hypothetical protein
MRRQYCRSENRAYYKRILFWGAEPKSLARKEWIDSGSGMEIGRGRVENAKEAGRPTPFAIHTRQMTIRVDAGHDPAARAADIAAPDS